MTDCCLCVFTRPQPYMRLISSLYPKGSRGNDIHEEILQSVDIGKLSKYAIDKPKYLVYIGVELSNRIRNYLRKGKLGYVMVSIKAVASIWEGISGSSSSNTGGGTTTSSNVAKNDIGIRTIFEDHVITLLLMLLVHPHIELRTIAAELCGNFINGQDYLVDQPRLEGFIYPLLHIIRYQNDKTIVPPVWYTTLWNNAFGTNNGSLSSSSSSTPLPWIPPSFTTDPLTVKARIAAIQAIGNLLKKSDASSLDNRIVIILPLILHTIHRELMISYWMYLSNHTKEYLYQYFGDILGVVASSSSFSSFSTVTTTSSHIHDKVMLYLLDQNLLPLSNILIAADHVLTILARVLNPATATAILEPLFTFFDSRSWQPLSMILHVMRIFDPCNGFIKHSSNPASNLSDNFTAPDGLYDNDDGNDNDYGGYSRMNYYGTGLTNNNGTSGSHRNTLNNNNLKFSTSVSSPPTSPTLNRYTTDNLMNSSRYLPGHYTSINSTRSMHHQLSSTRTTVTTVISPLRHRVGPALARAAFSTPGVILLLRHLTSIYALFESNVILPAATMINTTTNPTTTTNVASSNHRIGNTSLSNGNGTAASNETDILEALPLPIPGTEKVALASYPSSLWWLASSSSSSSSSANGGKNESTSTATLSNDVFGNARLQIAEKSFDDLRTGILSIANLLLTETGTDVPFGPWISEILDYILPTIVDPTYNTNTTVPSSSATDSVPMERTEPHLIHRLADEIIANLCIRLESGPDILRLAIGLAEGYGEHVAEYGSLIYHPIFHTAMIHPSNESGSNTSNNIIGTPIPSHRFSVKDTSSSPLAPLLNSSRLPIHSIRSKSTSLIRQVSSDINGLRRQPSTRLNTVPVIDETNKVDEVLSNTISNEEIIKAANAAANMVLHTHTYSNRVRSVLRRPSALAALGPLVESFDNNNIDTKSVPKDTSSSTKAIQNDETKNTVLLNAIQTAKIHAYAARQRLLQCLHLCMHRYRVLSSQSVSESTTKRGNKTVSSPTVTVQVSSEIFAALEIAMAEDDNQLRKTALIIMHHLLCSDVPVGTPDIDGTMEWCKWSEANENVSSTHILGNGTSTVTGEGTNTAGVETSSVPTPWSFASIPWGSALSLTERHLSRLYTSLFYILRSSKEEKGATSNISSLRNEYALIARLIRDTVRIEGIEVIWRIVPFIWTIWDTANENDTVKDDSLLEFTNAVLEILSVYLLSDDIGAYLYRPIVNTETVNTAIDDNGSLLYALTAATSYFTSSSAWVTSTKKVYKERIKVSNHRSSLILLLLASPITRAYLRDIQVPVPEEISIVDLSKTLLPSLSKLPLDPSQKLVLYNSHHHHSSNSNKYAESKDLVSWLYPSGNQENNWNVRSGFYLRHLIIEMDNILRNVQQQHTPSPPSPSLPTLPTLPITPIAVTGNENENSTNDTSSIVLPSSTTTDSVSALPPKPVSASLPIVPAPDLRKAFERLNRRRHPYGQHSNAGNNHSFTRSFYSDGLSDGSTASDTGKGSSSKDSSMNHRSSYVSLVEKRILECLGQCLLLPLNSQSLIVCDGLIEITRDGEQRIHLHVFSSSSFNISPYSGTNKDKDSFSTSSSVPDSHDKSPVRRYAPYDKDNGNNMDTTADNDNDVRNDSNDNIANDDAMDNNNKGITTMNSTSVIHWKPTKGSLQSNPQRAVHGPNVNDIVALLSQPNTKKGTRLSALDYERQKKMFVTNSVSNKNSIMLLSSSSVTGDPAAADANSPPSWLQLSREPAVPLRYY